MVFYQNFVLKFRRKWRHFYAKPTSNLWATVLIHNEWVLTRFIRNLLFLMKNRFTFTQKKSNNTSLVKNKTWLEQRCCCCCCHGDKLLLWGKSSTWANSSLQTNQLGERMVRIEIWGLRFGIKESMQCALSNDNQTMKDDSYCPDDRLTVITINTITTKRDTTYQQNNS